MKAVADVDLKNRISHLISSGQLTKTDFGLSNVQNTSDVAKPVSSAQQSALDLKVDKTSVGAVSGVASLDASTKLPLAQLPAFSLASGKISDVQIATPSSSQVLTFDGTNWVNAAAGGGSNLTSNEIVVGVGESSSPQTCLIRGPQAAGSSIKPGDLILRSEGGTGSWGSGNIRFQTSLPATVYPLYHANTQIASTTSTSYYTIIPSSGFQNMLLLLCIQAQNTSDTVTAMTFGAANFTAISSVASTTGFIKFAYLANPAASNTISITYSASTTGSLHVLLLENAATVTVGGSQTTASGTLLTTTVANVKDGDMVIDCCVQKNSAASGISYSHLPTQSFVKAYFYGTNNMATLTTSATVSSGSVTMQRSSTTSVPAILLAVCVQMFRSASSTAATFSDSIVITNTGRISYPLSMPSSHYEFTNMATILIKWLTPTSPRYQTLKNQSGNARVLILPRADLLPIGTTFFIEGTNSTSPVYTIPRYGGAGAGSASGFDAEQANALLNLGSSVNTQSATLANAQYGSSNIGVSSSVGLQLATWRLVSNEGAGMWIATHDANNTKA